MCKHPSTLPEPVAKTFVCVSAAEELYEANEAQEAAAVTLHGQALAEASAAVLSKVLGNIMQNPAEAKYR